MIPSVSPRRASFCLVTAVAASLCALLAVPVPLAAHSPAPSAPVNLVANPLSTTQIELKWVKTETDATRFVIEEFVDNVWKVVRTTKPDVQRTVFSGLAPGSLHLFRLAAKNLAGLLSSFTGAVGAVTDRLVAPFVCAVSDVCLLGDRFRVEVGSWPAGGTGFVAGGGEQVRDNTGLFYYFNPDNLETLVKVLNACSLNNRFWVLGAGIATVANLLTITDTERGRVRTYYNPGGRPFPPIQDTSAFATCP